jgi:hypothetical protein
MLLQIHDSSYKVGDSRLLNSIVAELYIIPMYDLTIFTDNFLMLANVFLRVGMPHSCMGMFHGKERGIQVLGGLAPSS